MPKTSELMSELIVEVLRNAHDLVVDAEVLLDAERWTRAYALATLALEEVGKAWLAEQHVTFTPDERFRRRKHVEKLIAAREFAAMFSSLQRDGAVSIDAWFSEEHEYLAEDDFHERMTGLYVDLADGEVVGGHTSGSAESARGTVELAGAVVHQAMHVLWQKHGGPVIEAPPTGGGTVSD